MVLTFGANLLNANDGILIAVTNPRSVFGRGCPFPHSRHEFQQPGGLTVLLQNDSRQNWWRDGAVALMP
jgi:hypothetical protein